MLQRLCRFRKDQRGIAALEIAFIMPFLLFLYFGLVDLTAMISLNRKVTYAASVVADLVTQNDGTVYATVSPDPNYGAIDDYFKAAELVLYSESISGFRIQLYNYRNESGTVNLKWSRSTATGSACAAPSTAGMASLMTDGNDIIVAVVCTTYTPFVATFLGKQVLGATTFPMSEQIALRPRQSATLNCSGCT